MTNVKLLAGAVLSLTLVGAGASFAAKSPLVETQVTTASLPVVSFNLPTLDQPQIDAQETYETAQARPTRAERRAARRAARAERRAARRGGQNTGSVSAPFGFLADGVTPRSQPATRSDQRLEQNGGVLTAADSFRNENNR